MQSLGMFRSPISCGAWAGMGAGVIWVLMIWSQFNAPPRTLAEYYSENALRAALCLGAVLCGPALYFRKISILKGVAVYSALLWLGAYACMALSSRLALGISPTANPRTVWGVSEVLYVLILCPFLGAFTGYFLSRLYGIPHLALRAAGFGVLGCLVHLLSGLTFSFLRLLNVDVAVKDLMALNVMCALLGYVCLGVVSAIPFDQHSRLDDDARAEIESANEVNTYSI